MKINKYYDCDTLYHAIAFDYAECHIGSAISEKEYDEIIKVKNESQNYILLAKELVKLDPQFLQANTEEKVNIIRNAVLLLYGQDKNMINKIANFLNPSDKKNKQNQKTLRFLV